MIKNRCKLNSIYCSQRLEFGNDTRGTNTPVVKEERGRGLQAGKKDEKGHIIGKGRSQQPGPLLKIHNGHYGST